MFFNFVINWRFWCVFVCSMGVSTAFLHYRFHQSPHIVFIMVDDMGWNDVSYHGSDQILTPNIDTLALRGVKLEQYYSEAICTPARTALLTGKYPMRLGMQGRPLLNSEDRGIPLTEKLLPSYLKDIGYSTHLVGKWHVGMSRPQYLPTSRGYDTHYGMRGGFIDYYTYNKIETWPNGRLLYGLDLFDNDEPQNEEQRYIVDALTDRAVKKIVTHVDQSIGEIVNALSEMNMLENTIIIFASDNGAPTNGEFANWGVNLPFRGKKNTPWEGGVRVPAFIWHASLRPMVWTGLMHITDWLPTLLAAAGTETTKEIDGVNQWESIIRNKKSQRKEVLIAVEDSSTNVYAAYRSGDYKIVVGNVTGLSNAYYGEEYMIIKGQPPEYITCLRSSKVARIFEKMGIHLHKEDIWAMRRASSIKPQGPLTNVTLCEPTPTRGCLYNVREDPSERRDLWQKDNKIAFSLTSRLRALWAMQQRRGPTALSSDSDPASFNYTWMPWINRKNEKVDITKNSNNDLNKISKVSTVRQAFSNNKNRTIAAAVKCEGATVLKNFLCILKSVF